MKKLEGRSLICLLLVLAMLVGLVYFIVRLEINGSKWASYYANSHIFNNGILVAGEIKDRKGEVLLRYDEDGAHYAGEEYERRAISSVVGDAANNINTGANVVFRSRLVSYNPVTGTEGFFGIRGGSVTLSIDKEINNTAYNALGSRNGFVGVYDYTTGDIVCLVSTPTVDPANPADSESAPSGAYINKVFNARDAPGSTFKVLTAAAALENIKDIRERTFTCTGSDEIEGSRITCPKYHGTMDFSGALANSCNCVFGKLAVEMGPKVMKKYVDEMGLTSSYDVNGIHTLEGSFRPGLGRHRPVRGCGKSSLNAGVHGQYRRGRHL